jgi:hypothetical protein
MDNLDAQEYATKLHETYHLIKAGMAFAQGKKQENVDR